MHIQEIVPLLLDSIEATFKLENFVLNRNNKIFSRKEGGVTNIFKFSFIKENHNILVISPEISIKMKSIEDIYKKVSIDNKFPQMTLGNHLFEIARYIENGAEINKKNTYNWLIEDESDIKKLIEVIPKYFFDIALPYFTMNSTVGKVDALLNKHPLELSIHHYLYPERAIIALIAAKLNNNINYKSLESLYEQELEQAHPKYKQAFFNLKKFFAERSPI